MKHPAEPSSQKQPSNQQTSEQQISEQQAQSVSQPNSSTTRNRQQQHLSPLWLLLVLSLLSVPWLLLHHRGTASQQQQAQISLRSERFFTQVNETPKNESATQFDKLAATLGFLPNDRLSLNVHPVVHIDADAHKQHKTIEPLLNHFLAERLGGSAKYPIPPLNSGIKAYLTSAQPKITAIQTHLLQQAPPQWEVNVDLMSEEDYPFPGLTNVFGTQKLLLLSAILHSEQNQQSEMLAALEASWRLNYAIAQRPDLVSKLAASTITEYQARLLRHTANLPQSQLAMWQQRLSQQATQQSVLKGIRFDTWLQYQTLQKSLSQIATQSNPLAIFSPIHGFNLSNINTAQTTHRAIDFLSSTNVCELSQSDVEAQILAIQPTQSSKAKASISQVLARRWKQAGDRALSLELTQQVLQAQQHYRQQGKWTSQWPEPSQTQSNECPSAQWIQQPTDSNTLTIRLSHKLTPPPSQPLIATLTVPLDN